MEKRWLAVVVVVLLSGFVMVMVLGLLAFCVSRVDLEELKSRLAENHGQSGHV